MKRKTRNVVIKLGVEMTPQGVAPYARVAEGQQYLTVEQVSDTWIDPGTGVTIEISSEKPGQWTTSNPNKLPVSVVNKFVAKVHGKAARGKQRQHGKRPRGMSPKTAQLYRRIVRAYEKADCTVAELCRRYSVGRSTYYTAKKWVASNPPPAVKDSPD